MEKQTKHFQLSQKDVENYAWASGDINPIHFSEKHAKKMGLPGVIAHGLCAHAIMLNFVEELVAKAGSLRVKSSSTAFKGMVVLPAKLSISVEQKTPLEWKAALYSDQKPDASLVDIGLQLENV